MIEVKDLQAVILAGGLGTRLRPVISEVPKCLAPIHGKSFLEYLLESLKRKGIREVLLCVSYKKDMIIDYFRDGNDFGMNIKYSLEEEPLGTGGALKNAQPLLRDHFLVMNGDTFPLFDIKDLLDFYIQKKDHCLGAIALCHHSQIADKGSVAVMPDGKVISFDEKVENGGIDSLVNTGTYLFCKDIFSINSWKVKCSLEKKVFPDLVEKGCIFGIDMRNGFLHIGLPEEYRKIEKVIDKRGILCR